MISRFDHLERRCAALGQQIRFEYCRSAGHSRPCRRILDCWFERIPVREFAEEHFSEEVLDDLRNPAPPKMATLIEMIQRSRSQNGE